MTPGQKAYESFNKSIGTITVLPFNKLPPYVKQAWEDTAKSIKIGDQEQCTSSKD